MTGRAVPLVGSVTLCSAMRRLSVLLVGTHALRDTHVTLFSGYLNLSRQTTSRCINELQSVRETSVIELGTPSLIPHFSATAVELEAESNTGPWDDMVFEGRV